MVGDEVLGDDGRDGRDRRRVGGIEVPELGVSVEVPPRGAWVPVEDSAHNHVETQG